MSLVAMEQDVGPAQGIGDPLTPSRLWRPPSAPVPEEHWRPVVGYENRLMVSNSGRIKRGLGSQPLEPTPDIRGYCHIRPCTTDGKRACIRVHAAVWTAFVGPIPVGCTIDHVDRDRSNNKLSNLRPATASEQRKNTAKHNLRRDARAICVWYLSDPSNVMTFDHSRKAAEELGANQRALRSVANGKVKRTGEFGARWAMKALYLEGEKFRRVELRGCCVSVSNHGRLLDGKSKDFAVTPRVTRGNDYATCGTRSVQMHLAVAKAWPELVQGQPGPGLTIDHIDRDVNNNHPSNLRWATAQQQAANRRSSGNTHAHHHEMCDDDDHV